MSGKFYDIELREYGDLDLAGEYLDEVNDLIADCIRKCPDGARKGVIMLGGVECYYRCATVASKVQLSIGPRRFCAHANGGAKINIVVEPEDGEEWSPWSRLDA